MFKLDEEIKAWQQLLNEGEIDETTYNKEISRLIRKDEKRKKYKKIKFYYILKVSSKMIIFLIILVILIWIYNNIHITKNIESVQSLSNIEKPIQIKTSGNTTKEINGTSLKINYVATYSISGRVVGVHNYYGYNIGNQLSPKDVGISWGFLANEKNHKKIKWSLGNRFLNWYSSDGKWINEVGGKNEINEHCSNNHLIPSNSKVKKLINSIKKDDYIRIEGYLVDVYGEKSNGGSFYWNTSTSRSDSGNGACEVVYVTSITWLKLEK